MDDESNESTEPKEQISEIDEIKNNLWDVINTLKHYDKRMDAIETKQTDYLLIDMEELAKYVKIAIGNLKAIGSENDLFEIKQIQESKGDAHAFIIAFDQLQNAGVNARMAITVLFSIMNVMNRFEHKIIYNEESNIQEQ